MFKAVWNGIRWFFRQDDLVDNKITRKYNHVHISATDGGTMVKVKGYETNTETKELPVTEIIDTYKVMTILADKEEMDTIEFCKSELINPLGLTEDHLLHALQCCGFQRTHNQKGQPAYDPRLLQALRLAVNMHSAQVSIEAGKMINMIKKHTDK